MDNPLITYLQLFREIPAGDQLQIADAFEHLVVKEGDTLFEAGKVCRQIFFVTMGVLRIMADSEKGVAVTHYFLKENQFCTILNSFNNEIAADESIEAACNAEIMVISKAKLLALYEKLPYLKTLIDQIMQQALLDKIQIRNAFLGQDSTTRYKLFMMRQADIALRVSLTDIASYLGITPQSFSRIRKNIK